MPYSLNLPPAPQGQQNNQGMEMLIRYLMSQNTGGAAAATSQPPAGTTYNPTTNTMSAPGAYVSPYQFGTVGKTEVYQGGGYRPIIPESANKGGGGY